MAAAAINENSGAGQVIYTATASDSGDISGGVTFSLKAGSDAGLTIDPTTGAVTLTGNPDYESKASYSFTVVATDAAGNASSQAVTLAVNNLDEVAPVITSGTTATAMEALTTIPAVTARRMAGRSPAPNARATGMATPADAPNANPNSRNCRLPEAPTAASASTPSRRPTTNASVTA